MLVHLRSTSQSSPPSPFNKLVTVGQEKTSPSSSDLRRSRTQSTGTSDQHHHHYHDYDDHHNYDDHHDHGNDDGYGEDDNYGNDGDNHGDDGDDDDDTDVIEALGDKGNVRSKLLLILFHPSLAKELPAFVFVSVFLYLHSD